jgi:predicted kinase
MLIAFGGLPGTGKTTLARMLATQFSAAYLRIDTIEQALRDSDVLAGDVGPAGYIVAYQLAAENLRVGRSVVADSMNPLQVTRRAWADVAKKAKVLLIEVEVVCSDDLEHRRRVEQRTPDIKGLLAPTWETVKGLNYQVWNTPNIVIDTASKSILDVSDELQAKIMDVRQLSVHVSD